jgi:hypothetical protein
MEKLFYMQNFLTKVFGLISNGLVLRQVPPFQHIFSSAEHDTYNDGLLFLNTSISSVDSTVLEGRWVVKVEDGKATVYILAKAYEAK